MEYNKLVAVTGMSGLFELISSKTDSGIVRSLEDNSTKFVSSRIHNFSHLESIEVYTTRENVNLADVFLAMQKSKVALPDAKADAKAIRSYFETVYPDMDFDRVYGSDMKKMVKWFDILLKNKIEINLPTEHAEPELKAETSKKSTASASAAPKTAAVKSAPPKKINTPRKMA